MGDIGGLFDAMKLLGHFLISFATFVAGSGLDRFLISQLFKFEKKKNRRYSTFDNDAKKQIGRRVPAKFNACRWLLQWRQKDASSMFDQATDRLSKELDIVNFLKRLMIDGIQRRTLFTRADRYLMKHQAHPFVLNPHRASSSDSSAFNYELSN